MKHKFILKILLMIFFNSKLVYNSRVEKVTPDEEDLFSGLLKNNRYEDNINPENQIVTTSFNDTTKESQFNETEMAEDMLQWFQTQLRSFVSDSHFDTFRFEVVAEKLTEDLQDIWAISNGKIFQNSQLLNQFGFARQMLQTMVYSKDILTYYDFVGTAEVYLLNRIVDLNVRLLAMCNKYGELLPEETKSPGDSSRVLIYLMDLFLWESYFRKLKVENHVKVLFENQVFQAKETLKTVMIQFFESADLAFLG